MARMHYHFKKDVEYINIKKKLLVSRIILKIMFWFYTITSGQTICWVLVMLLLYEYNVAIMYV